MGPMGPWGPWGPWALDKFGAPTVTPIAFLLLLKNALFQNFEHVNSQICQNWSDLVRFGHHIINIIKYH